MPKLTLRDLFFVVTLAAVLVAWWVDHRSHDKVPGENRRLRLGANALKSELEKHPGCFVTIEEDGSIFVDQVMGITP